MLFFSIIIGERAPRYGTVFQSIQYLQLLRKLHILNSIWCAVNYITTKRLDFNYL